MARISVRRKVILWGAVVTLCAALIAFSLLRGPRPKYDGPRGGASSPQATARRATHGIVLTGIRVKSPPIQGVRITSLKIDAVTRPTTAESYADLVKSAHNGDGKSAYVLFRLLRTCSSLAASPKALAKRRPTFDETWCEQVPNSNFDYVSWLRGAIRDGSIPATLAAYREDVPNVCESGANSTGPVTQVVPGACPLVTNAINAAVKAGSLNAVVAVGAREVWSGTPDATETSYAYIYAAAQGLKMSAAQGIDVDDAESASYQSLLESESTKYSKWMDQLSTKLDAPQLAQAQKMGNTILLGMSSCCQLFPRELPPP